MGMMALLECSNLSNLILYFPIRALTDVSLMWARVSHSSLLMGWQQGYTSPADQSHWLSTDLNSHPQPMCQDDAEKSQVTASDINHFYSTSLPLSFNQSQIHQEPSQQTCRHLSHKWQPLDLVCGLHLQRVKCPTGSWRSWAQAMHSPDGNR